MRIFCTAALFLSTMLTLWAQQEAKLTILADGNRGSKGFKEVVKAEINALLSSQYDLSYREINLNEVTAPATSIIQAAFQDDSNILITLGFQSSGLLQAAGEYPKPSLAGISLERTDKTTSEIPNYTYIQSPFSIERDLAAFQSIRPFRHLGIFLPASMQSTLPSYINGFADGIDIQFIPISNDPEVDLNQLNDEIEAIYFLPNLYNSSEDYQVLIDGVNARKLPSFSLIGRTDVEKGILASLAPSNYLNVYARRIAINVMKVLEGENPKDLPIQISGIEDDFVINVATMEQIEVYPPFEVLGKASLIKLEPQTGNQYTLQSAIAEALSNNLALQAASKEVDVQQTEIGIANANLLPNVEASTTFVTIDGTSSEFLKAANQLTPQTEWSGNIGLTQLIFSQPAIANLAIQKALLRSEEAGLMSQQLDLVLDVCEAYIGILQAQANVNIQNTNVQTTLSNLNIAKNKAKIGALSNADVYGFESQLALNKSSLNDAVTLVAQAKINFNQLLNQPLDEEILLEDIQNDNDLLFLYDERIFERVNNYYDFREFAEFLIDFALKNAPELDQLAWAIKAQETSLKNNQKSLYLPQVALQANLDQTFGRYGIKVPDEQFESIGIDPYQPTWNVAINASLPIFQGNLRTKRIQKDKILLDQLALNKASLELQFSSNIRLSLENLANSYNNIRFTGEAEASSRQFLEVIQNLYREGASNIATLLDAQNNALSAQLGAVSSRYQFILDAVTIERLINKIYLLSDEAERKSFINAYFTFITKKDNDE